MCRIARSTGWPAVQYATTVLRYTTDPELKEKYAITSEVAVMDVHGTKFSPLQLSVVIINETIYDTQDFNHFDTDNVVKNSIVIVIL